MKRNGRARRAVLCALCPDAEVVVDVGADHGHVAASVGAIATERWPHLARRAGVRWVVADGLRPFRRVDVAVIAGMGARTIARILEAGPRPRCAVLHAADDPPRLRAWLAANQWRIDTEALAPEAGRYAEVMRVVPGREPSSGLPLLFGPRLLGEGRDPHLDAHLTQLVGYYRGLVEATRSAAPDKHRWLEACLHFLDRQRHTRGSAPARSL